MHRVVITVDSTADIPPELARLYDIHIIPLTVILGEESYPDGDGITPEMMYERYHADGTLPKTAAPSVQAFEDFFRPFTEAGDSVVHLDIGSELSNAYNAARLAAADMGSVYVIDTRSLCCGIALLAIEGAECRDRGMSAEEIAARLTALRDKVSVSFVLDTLEFIWKGGRCSGVTAIGSSFLNIRPSLEMREGKLVVAKKYRGSSRAVRQKYLSDRLEGKKFLTEHVFFANSGEIDEGELDELETFVRSRCVGKQVHRARAGCTICGHCGPGTLAVFYIEE